MILKPRQIGNRDAVPVTSRSKSGAQTYRGATTAGAIELLAELCSNDALEPIRTASFSGIDIWPIIKATAVMRVLNAMQVAPYGTLSSPSWQTLATWICQRFGRAGSRQFQTEAEVLCLANSAPAIRVGGHVLNPHLDPLRVAFEKVEIDTVTAYYDVSYQSGLRFAMPSIGLATETLSARSMPSLLSRSDKLRTILKPLEAVLARYGLRGDAGLFGRVMSTAALAEYYFNFFARSPKLRGLLLTNYYNPHGWAAVAAAARLGIPSADVQHGVQGPYHHAYSWPEISGRVPNTLPQYYLCWTEEDVANLRQHVGWGDKAMLAGPSCFQLDALASRKEKMAGPASEALERYRSGAAEIFHQAEAERASGRTIVGLFMQYKEEVQWLHALRRHLPDAIALWVRRHPGVRNRGRMPSPPEIKGVRYVDHIPLAPLLQSIDLVVTGYSSVGIEAAHAGIPVISYSEMSEFFFGHICRENGYHTSSDNPGILASAIASQTTGRSGGPRPRRLPEMDEVRDWLECRLAAPRLQPPGEANR